MLQSAQVTTALVWLAVAVALVEPLAVPLAEPLAVALVVVVEACYTLGLDIHLADQNLFL